MMKKLLFSVLLLLMVAIGAVAQEQTLTVYEGTTTNSYVPMYGGYFDDFTRTQFVIPADDLADMAGGQISEIKFYTTSQNVPYTTVSSVDVYLMEVDYTSISVYEAKTDAQIVYSGFIEFVSADDGGETTITFETPYTYNGGNLLIGCENTTDAGYKFIYFYGQTVNGASISASNSSSLANVTPSQRNFIPKTTFTYTPGAPTTCQKPTELAKSNLTARTVDLAWVAGGEETEWQICLNGNEDNLTVATTNPYTLENLTPETAYTVKVRANCGSEQSRWSNTVSFTTLPSCFVPTALAYADVTSNSAVLSWTAGASETAWQICINNNEDDLVDVTENPYTLTGLDPATTYSVKVRANCGDTDGNSQWTSAVSFTTECEVLTVDADHPYAEGFEDVTGSYAIPTCWERIIEYTSYGSTYPYVVTNGYTTYSHGGDKSLYMSTSSYNSAYENLIALPVMNGINTLQISLWAKASSTIPENFEIGYIKNGVFTSVQSFTLTTTYQQFTAYLNGAPADAERIAIRAHHSSSSITVYVDDIEVSPMPTCIAPVDVVVSGITTNAASVSWTDVLPATAWQYQLNDGDIEDVDAKPINLTELTANTEYTIKVRTVCGENEYSDWAEVSFTTLCEAVAEFPWTETFNSLTVANSIPSCWDNSEGTTTDASYKWCYTTSTNYYGNGSSSGTSHDNSNCVRFESYSNSNNNTNMLKTIQLDLTELTSAKLEFWYKNPTGGDFSVYVSTDGGATYMTNVVATDLTGVTNWTNATYDISSYCGNSNVVIVFVGTSNYGSGDAYIYLDDVTVREPSTAAEILTYSLPTQVSEATIGDGTIEVTVANSTDFDVDLTPTYTISENAEISDPVVTGEGDVRTIAYTVTAEAGNTKDWTVTVTKAPVSHDAFITAFTFANQKPETEAVIVSDTEAGTYTVNAVATWNADLTAIAPEVTISNAATVAPASGETQDFTNPVTYTVTAEDGTTAHAYTVTIVNDPDACINPTDLQADNVTAHEATLNWVQGYTETSYLVKVSTEAMTDMTATADVFDGTVEATTKALEGLTANTEYFVYVQSDCDNAEGWTSANFLTECEAIVDFPWTENFNSLTVENSIPSCWDNSEGTTTNASYKWCYTTSTNYNGNGSSSGTSHDNSNCVRFESYSNSSNNTNMLKTVPLDLSELTSAKLDFWYKNPTGGDFSVYVSTDGGATYTDNVIATGLTGVTDWTNGIYDISTYCGNSNVVIVFKGTSNWGSGDAYIYLDDVNVHEISTEAEIVDFDFPMIMSEPVINSENATVTADASYQADLNALGETVTVSDYAEYVENSAVVDGDVKTITYTVTAEDGTTKDWTVTVTKAAAASTANDIVSFEFAGQVGESVIDAEAKTVTAYAEWDFDFENNTIAPTIEVSPMATINPASGDAQNFSAPVQYAVTAEDGESVANWTVTITNDPNACVNPTAINVDEVTATTATLSWDKIYLETSYLVKVSTTPMTDMTAEADVYDDVVTLAENADEATLALTDLSATTFYYVYVQSNCGAEDWTDAYFATECDGSAYPLPFVETFDLTSNSLLCWSTIDANNDGEENSANGIWNFVSEQAAYVYSSVNAANDWLVSPKLTMVDGAYLTFDYAVDNDYYPEKFSVYVMTDIADYATATQILATQTVTNETFATIDSIDLSAYAGQDIYIAIKCESEADMDALIIDNFKVSLPTYTITATAGENGTISPESAEVLHGNDQMFTITPNEGYRVASVIVDADTDAETDVTENVVTGDESFFYTFENVTANHTIHATFELTPTYTITVEAGENGTVLYNDALVSEPIVVTEGATPEFVITPETGYQIDVLTIDGEAVELTEVQLGGYTYTFEAVAANHTLAVTFVETVAVDVLEAGSMSIYPNPNNGMFSIDFSNIEGDATYQLIDARGAVVETRNISLMNGETMNFNHNLTAGTYFVRIINGDKVYVEQIVVE